MKPCLKKNVKSCAWPCKIYNHPLPSISGIRKKELRASKKNVSAWLEAELSGKNICPELAYQEPTLPYCGKITQIKEKEKAF